MKSAPAAFQAVSTWANAMVGFAVAASAAAETAGSRPTTMAWQPWSMQPLDVGGVVAAPVASLKCVVKPSAFASSRPFFARSLKLLSPRPPVSKATQAQYWQPSVPPSHRPEQGEGVPGPQAAKMMAAVAPSASSRLEIDQVLSSSK